MFAASRAIRKISEIFQGDIRLSAALTFYIFSEQRFFDRGFDLFHIYFQKVFSQISSVCFSHFIHFSHFGHHTP